MRTVTQTRIKDRVGMSRPVAGRHELGLRSIELRRRTSTAVRHVGRRHLPHRPTSNGQTPLLVICVTYSIYVALSRRSMLKLECGPMPNVMAALPNIHR